MPITFLPFPTTGCLKYPACKKGMLSPLSECYSDGWVSLSGLFSLIMTCCFWRLQILSQYVSLFSFCIFLSIFITIKKDIQSKYFGVTQWPFREEEKVQTWIKHIFNNSRGSFLHKINVIYNGKFSLLFSEVGYWK
jgi:hypothetical protein